MITTQAVDVQRATQTAGARRVANGAWNFAMGLRRADERHGRAQRRQP